MKSKSLVSSAKVENLIVRVRGHNVMLDKDLADLYKVETKYLSRQVTRNIDRFPKDFMFVLTEKEFENLRCQFGTSRWGGRRYLPRVFTEQGVAMLSSVLRSKRAVKVNIEIMRTFVKLREMLASNAQLSRKLNALERKYDTQFKVVFDAIRQLMTSPVAKKKQIGFDK